MVTQPHVIKGIISFRATILGGKSFFFEFLDIFGKISTALMLHLHFYLKFTCSPSSNTKKTLFLHQSSPMLAQLCLLAIPKIKGDIGMVGGV